MLIFFLLGLDTTIKKGERETSEIARRTQNEDALRTKICGRCRVDP
jgi:hypothetical protein